MSPQHVIVGILDILEPLDLRFRLDSLFKVKHMQNRQKEVQSSQ